jgi:hypothetical protein
MVTPINPKTELLINGTWTDITSYTRAGDGAVITRGLPDESTATQPSSLTLTLKNPDGRFSSRNPLGAYYPYLVQNTQVRVSVPEGASYLRAEGDQGSYAYCSDSAGISITGDTEIQLDVTLDNWRSRQALAGKWFAPMAQRSWQLVLGEDGTLTFSWSAAGVSTISAVSTLPVPVPALHRQAIKVTISVASGTVTFYTAPAGLNQVLSGPITTGWVQLGAAVVAGATSIFDGTGGLYVSGVNQIGWMSDAANIHSCHLVDGTTTRVFFDTPDSFSSGGNPTTDPRQDSYTSQPLLNYTSYAQFKADSDNAGYTQNSILYTPAGPINAVFKWVRYDIESWTQTPIEERQDPQTYIGNFITQAHAKGFKCIITPGRDLGNTDTAHPKLSGETINAWYVRTNIAAACSAADAFEVQNQANQGTAEFVSFFTAVQAQAKAASVNLPVWCGLSVTYGNGQVMYNAAKSVVPLADGYWINIIGNTTDSLDLMRRLIAGPLTTQIPEMNGKTHSLKLLSGIAGTVKASPDFTAATAGAASFTDAQSNTWKMFGTAEVSNRRYRFHGEVASWPKNWDQSGRAVFTSVTGNGPMRRLGQSSKPVDSAMTRYWKKLAAPPVAFWPCEDLTRATAFSSGLTGGLPMLINRGNPKFASDSSAVSSLALPALNNATWSGTVPGYTTGAGHQVTVFMSFPSGGDTDGTIPLAIKTSGTIALVVMRYDQFSSGTLTVYCLNSDYGVLSVTAPTFNGVNGKVLAVRISIAAPAGGNSTVTFEILRPGASSVSSGTDSVPATKLGAIQQVIMNLPDFALNTAKDIAAGQIAVQDFASSLSAWTGQATAVNAWQGEAAGTRFARLCSEEAIAFRGNGQLTVTSAMGPQTPAALLSLLQDCADADRGILFEPRQAFGLGYRTRYSLSNQSPAVTLNYSQATLSGLEPTDDDQNTLNDVTVSRGSGSSARQALTTGPKSTAVPPAGVGTYDTETTLNLWGDNQCQDEAGWLVHLGTVNEDRFPAISLNLRRSQLTGVFYDLQDLDIGDYLAITNAPAFVTYDGIKQIIKQAADHIDSFRFTIDLAGAPETPYETMLFDDSTYGRFDTDSSFLDAAIGTGDTSFSVQTTPGFNYPLWTTAGGDVPFDILVGGERMTVTAVSSNLLTGDASTFEGGIANWTGAGNDTIAQSGAQFHGGTKSLALTCNVTGPANMQAAHCTAANILTQGIDVLPGDNVTASVFFRTAATARACNIGVDVYDSTGTVVGSVLRGSDINDSSANFLTNPSLSVQAPASSYRMRANVQVKNAVNTEVHYVDDVFLSNGRTQIFTVTRAVNGVVKAHSAGESVSLFYPPVFAM